MIRRALSLLLLGALAVAGLIAAAVWLLAFTPLLVAVALLDRATRRVDPVDAQWATAPRETRDDITEWEMEMIRTFRKKPVEIQAVQWTGDNTTEVIDWVLSSGAQSARWHEVVSGVEPDEDGKSCDPIPEHIAIDTLEGTMRAGVGDWIIRGVKGEFYPCKPDIFEATHEEVSR